MFFQQKQGSTIYPMPSPKARCIFIRSFDCLVRDTPEGVDIPAERRRQLRKPNLVRRCIFILYFMGTVYHIAKIQRVCSDVMFRWGFLEFFFARLWKYMRTVYWWNISKKTCNIGQNMWDISAYKQTVELKDNFHCLLLKMWALHSFSASTKS